MSNKVDSGALALTFLFVGVAWACIYILGKYFLIKLGVL